MTYEIFRTSLLQLSWQLFRVPQLSALLPEDVDISPRTAAEYLMITGDFDSFDQAIVDLVESDLVRIIFDRTIKLQGVDKSTKTRDFLILPRI